MGLFSTISTHRDILRCRTSPVVIGAKRILRSHDDDEFRGTRNSSFVASLTAGRSSPHALSSPKTTKALTKHGGSRSRPSKVVPLLFWLVVKRRPLVNNVDCHELDRFVADHFECSMWHIAMIDAS